MKPYLACINHFRFLKRAVFTAFFFASCFALAETPPEPCSLGPLTGEEVFAKSVHDGDTLTLTNGDKVRLIGINTPELAREGRPAEPFSRKAQKTLSALVMNKPLLLGIDQQERDRYGRLLAHIFTKDGVNINAKMLEAGLATQIIVPPNLGIESCYAKTEAIARCQKKGIWQLEALRPKQLAHLSEASPRYLILNARVQHYEKKEAHKLWLGPKHRIEISKRDFKAYFSNAWLKDVLASEDLIIRGWLHSKNDEYIVRIRHPRQMTSKADFSCLSE